MLPLHNGHKVTSLEEGFFGLKNVKLGTNGKERGVLLRNVQGFRRAVVVGLLVLVISLGFLVIYWRRASNARMELVVSGVLQKATECKATIEGILLHQDEIDELCRRLKQREVLDSFLSSERALEVQLKARISKIARGGPESKERQKALDDSLMGEMQWFKDAMGDSIELIIAPLDKVFKDVPNMIRTLQADIKAELPVFKTSPPGICSSLATAIAGAPWEQSFFKRVRRLVDLGRNSTSPALDQKMMAKWVAARDLQKGTPELPADLVVMLLTWYATASPSDLSNVLLSMEPVLHNAPVVTDSPEEKKDDDDDDDDKDDDKDDDDKDDQEDDDKKNEEKDDKND